ncbi:MAG: ERCC4 domain-containing protein [Nanoarchaeota archaeon]
MTFHNIFSNKPLENQKPKILIDNREKNSLVPSEISKLGFSIEFTQLKVGDYIVSNIPIERKTISDLKSSIINKRIFDQLRNLEINKGILIIEGIQDENIYSGIIHENALRGFFLSLAIKNKVPFLFSQNAKDTAKYLSILSKRSSDSSISLRQSRVFPSKEEQIQFILEGFPNIGPVKSKELINRFKSIRNIINAEEKDLESVLGKGAKEFMQLII